jgi:hypothetical protein
MADVVDQYAMADAWDEMFIRPGEPRPAYGSLFADVYGAGEVLSDRVARGRDDAM